MDLSFTSHVALATATRKQLLSYLTGCLPPVDWCAAESLADTVEQHAADVDIAFRSPESDQDSGLPSWLAAITRRVVREYLSPAAAADVVVRVRPAMRQDLELQTWELELLQHGLVDAPPVTPASLAA